MLVFRMSVEMAGRWFEDMGRRNAPGGNSPLALLQKHGSFGLGTCKAELSGIARQPPCGMVLTQCLQAFGDRRLVKPFDLVFGTASQDLQPIGRDELDGTCAVLADMGNKGKHVARGNLKFSGPPLEHAFVVGQEFPEESLHGGRTMLFGRERHGQRERIGSLGLAPVVVIDKGEPAASVVAHAANLLPSSRATSSLCLALATMALISTAGLVDPRADVCSVPAFRRMSKASKARRISPSSARAWPCSTSITHWRLTPMLLANVD